MKLDVSIGILYTTTMALAILFIGLMKTYNAEVYGYLFGNVLSVTPEELQTIGGLSVVVAGSILLFSKELYFAVLEGAVFYRIRSRNGRGLRRAGPADVFPPTDFGGIDRGGVPQDCWSYFSICHGPDPGVDRLPANP